MRERERRRVRGREEGGRGRGRGWQGKGNIHTLFSHFYLFAAIWSNFDVFNPKVGLPL